ncbi:CHASE2 domain-containing protein [candidate division KSB1 bacterium]
MATKESMPLKKRLMNLLIAISVSILVIFASLSKFYEITEYKLYDQRFLIRGPVHFDPDVATIDIDGVSLGEEGRFQDWTRDKHASLVQSIYDMGAKMVGFDIYFPEPSEKFMNYRDLVKNEEYLQNENVSKEFIESNFPDHDEHLAQVLEKTGIVFLGQSFKLGETGDSSYIEHNTIIPKGEAYESYRALENYWIDDPEIKGSGISQYVEIEPPILKLITSAKGVAFAMTVADIDGSVRKYPLIVEYDGKIFPSLALSMFCSHIGVDVKDIKIKPGAYIDVPEGTSPSGEKIKIRIPIDEKGKMLVNWAGKWSEKDFLHIPYVAAVNFSSLIRQEIILRKIKKIYHSKKDLFNAIDFETGEFNDDVINSFMEEYEKTEGSIDEIVPDIYFTLILVIEMEKDIINNIEYSEDKYPPGQSEMYAQLKYTYDMAEQLKTDPNLTLDEISRLINEPQLNKISSGFYLLTDIIREKELKEDDYPLYFLSPDIGGKILYPEDFEGKVFFYGLTAAGTWDLNPMPYMDRYPMLGLHANAFNTMLMGSFLKRLSVFQNIFIMLGLGVLIGFIVPVFKPINAAVMMAAIAIAYLVLAQYMFQSHGLWIDVLGPVTILLFGYTSATVYNFFSEEQEKKMIRGIFSRYVTKSVVDELIQNPDMVKLGGEKKVLTVFFSDVAGFTTISEALTPEELVALLNEYLTAMTNIVLSYDGMIDKYEGDAIMAVFGAPIHFDDHPTRACHVSLDMQNELINLRKKWKEENRPELYVRIGLNTGPMVVGNMGAADRFDYTVMGDSVNLGARLEGANKQYGTNIMISEFTYEMCKNDIESRFLDLLRVKGKNLPVTVYEVLAKKNDGLSGDMKKIVELYNQGLEYYRSLDWDNGIKSFEEALNIDPNDGPSKVYLERCKQCKINPPPSDWDGVFVMTTK